jgi:nicotinamidase-related amidase
MDPPRFYDPTTVRGVYVERAAVVAAEADATRERLGIAPAARDGYRIAAFGIDCQVGFCTPGASLFVPGAVEDTQRMLAWLYANVERITSLFFSMDTHRVFQIFHPAWWTDAEGGRPAPFTAITYDDVERGRWRPARDLDAALEYTAKLEASGRYVLTVWPFHTLLGGVSHALVPAVMEAAIFHAVLRGEPTRFETKGVHELTESYSVLAPEVQELGGRTVGTFNQTLFDALLAYDRVYVFGQAKSHCVLSTLEDIRARIVATDAPLIDKIWILEDAMSPVTPPPLDPLPPALDFPRVAATAFEALRAAGMHVARTTDPMVLPPR